MRRVVVINSKGGCGKTTIASSLAACYASSGRATALLDYDPQGSSMAWLEQRGADRAPIHGVRAAGGGAAVTRTFRLSVPPETERVVVDTPASLKRMELVDLIRGAAAILIPVLPSGIDQHVTAAFVGELETAARQAAHGVPVGLVANRTRTGSRAHRNLLERLAALDLPVVATLRETQHYVRCTEQGIGIHELKGASAGVDRKQWQALLEWLEEPAAGAGQAASLGGG